MPLAAVVAVALGLAGRVTPPASGPSVSATWAPGECPLWVKKLPFPPVRPMATLRQ